MDQPKVSWADVREGDLLHMKEARHGAVMVVLAAHRRPNGHCVVQIAQYGGGGTSVSKLSLAPASPRPVLLARA